MCQQSMLVKTCEAAYETTLPLTLTTSLVQADPKPLATHV